jgi:hypothetical protein
MNDYVFSNYFEIEYSEADHVLKILHPKVKAKGLGGIEISDETLAVMSFSEASQFVGERLLLSIPAMREMFKDYLWTENGEKPPLKS